MTADLGERALAFIAQCDDPAKLRQLASNADKSGNEEVQHAALLRLYAVLPSEAPGTLEHDVWQSIFALEGALAAERGKTVLLSRTRQKIARDGEHRTVADLVTGKLSDGFTMLLERKMPERSFEAVAMRHQDRFDEAVIMAATRRLREAGVVLKDA